MYVCVSLLISASIGGNGGWVGGMGVVSLLAWKAISETLFDMYVNTIYRILMCGVWCGGS